MKSLQVFISGIIFTVLLSASVCFGQSGYTIQIEPQNISLDIGDEVQLSGHVTDENGSVVSDSVRFFSRARRSLSIDDQGLAKALAPGEFTVTALFADENNNRVMQDFPVIVNYPPVESVTLLNVPDRLYTNSSLMTEVEIKDEAGIIRDNVDLSFDVDNEIVSVDPFGLIEIREAGSFRLTVRAEDAEATKTVVVEENPVRSVRIGNNITRARTGDVLGFDAAALDEGGDVVEDAIIGYTFQGRPDDQLGEGAAAQVDPSGRFVANDPGLYTLIAQSGGQVARQTVRVEPRNVQKSIELVGQGLVSSVHTSDLWIWEGADGRDYAITGTWGGNGEAYFWDVTDPENIIPVDTVTVDARTVNDVKISEDGTIGVLTREGASTRRNGIVILDVSDPHNVEILSEYTEGLTGGVHNAFIYEDHVYAVNNGTRYDIINIEDPLNPHTVNRFELDTPGHAIHDVWIEDGIAYSSNWMDGVVAVDVGSNAQADTPEGHQMGLGSPSNPVQLGQYAYPSGWNHAAFPFKSESTGDFYIIAGDEAFPTGLFVEDRPTVPAGWIHFIKFNSWGEPEEVARYQVPEAGTHNFWVDGDTLYVAYYNGGLRVVDISGELMGNLYDQGREIAHYVTTDHGGIIPNAPMSWGPQPHKGHIFVSDWNSGLWVFRLAEEEG